MNRLSFAIALLTIALTGGVGRFDAVAKEKSAAVAVYGDTVHTMAGPPIENGVVIIVDGKIIGAIGVSGVTSQQDAQIAKAGADSLK